MSLNICLLYQNTSTFTALTIALLLFSRIWAGKLVLLPLWKKIALYLLSLSYVLKGIYSPTL